MGRQVVGAGGHEWRRFAARNAIIIIFIVFVILADLATWGRFLSFDNLSIVLFQSTVVGVLVLGQSVVMLIAGIDLSIVTVAILAAIIMGAGGSERQTSMNLSGILPYLGFLPSITLAICGSMLIGLVNGVTVAIFKIPAFVVTLAMSLALAGAAMLMTGGSPVHYPDPFYVQFGSDRFFGLPLPIWVFITLAIILGFYLSRSAIGVRIYAIGGNPRAAALSGIRVNQIIILVYVLCSTMGGIAGFLFLARTGSVSPTSGGGLLLSTIAAVVVGGVSLYGGKGSIFNAVIATLFLAGLSNLLNMLHVSSHLQDAVSGVVIILAIMLNARLDPE